jgi:serine/threonine protein kinase
MILQDEPVPIKSRLSSIPDDLASVIHKALARNPAERYPDARVMCEALQPFRMAKNELKIESAHQHDEEPPRLKL